MMKMMMDGQQSFRNIKKFKDHNEKRLFILVFKGRKNYIYEQIFFLESEIITRFEDVLESRETNQIKRWKMQLRI